LRANQFLGQAYQSQGDYHRAIDCFGQTVTCLEGARSRERYSLSILPALNSRTNLAWCHAELGTFAEGLALGEEGLRVAEAVAHPYGLMVASLGVGGRSLRGLGTLYPKMGRQEQARTALATAIELYRAMEMTFWLPQAEAVLAEVEGCGQSIAAGAGRIST
jgi:tetratricopeptide (TPR) repeat protein